MSEPHGKKRKLKDYSAVSTPSTETVDRSKDSKQRNSSKKKKSNDDGPKAASNLPPPPTPPTPPTPQTSVVDPVVMKTQFDTLNSALETLLTTISSATLPSESPLTKEQDAFLNTLTSLYHGGALPWLPKPKFSEPTILPPSLRDVKNIINNHQPQSGSSLPPIPQIRNPKIRQQVFTHSSAIHPSSNTALSASMHMERLELLGDSYLHLILTRMLYDQAHLLREGNLTAMRNILESNVTLSYFSNAYGLPQQLRMGKAVYTNKTSGKFKDINKLDADVFEAYIGGLILDADSEIAGITTVRNWLEQLYDDKLREFRDSTRTALVDSTAKHRLYTKLIWYPMSKATIKYRSVPGSHYEVEAVFYGYGLGEVLLGKGTGATRNDAITRAAMDALGHDQICTMIVEKGKSMFPRPAQTEEKPKVED